MADRSGISWTDASWNPITGCSKRSPGCKFCFSERDWARLSANPKTIYYGRKFTDVQCHPERLDQPLRWTRARKIFVNSMSDLFHEDVPDDFIDRVFAIMALAPQHTFQILTKRPERMKRYMESCAGRVVDNVERFDRYNPGVVVKGQYARATAIRSGEAWPLPNVWLGVSVEDQVTADERISLLLETLTAVHWVSAEPLLSRIDIRRWLKPIHQDGPRTKQPRGIVWVVVGGETGSVKRSRPMLPAWAEDLKNQCDASAAAFFYKQEGSWLHIPSVEDSRNLPANNLHYFPDIDATFLHRKGGGAETLAGQTHQNFPIAA